ncbi:hypothetical protein HDU96_000135 [Phlyctochytrium bullatum]|nr:hypothetical protein HDU96_000135 [Phlyctochytrium bullatum]
MTMQTESLALSLHQVQTWLSNSKSRPLFVGISGPQGSGKTTLTTALVSELSNLGLRTASMSLDDFYLTRAEQIKVSEAHPGVALLEFRGNPGTHDVKLLQEVLDGLKGTAGRQEVAIPQYSKSMHGGRGDRMDKSTWPVAKLPLDVVLFEGWCVGFRPPPVSIPSLVSTSPATSPLRRHPLEDLQLVVDNLSTLHTTLASRLDALIHVHPPSMQDLEAWVHRWRQQQEDVLRERVGPENALTREQVREFVERFMPTYFMGMPALTAEEERVPGAERDWKEGMLLSISIDEERRVMRHHVV